MRNGWNAHMPPYRVARAQLLAEEAQNQVIAAALAGQELLKAYTSITCAAYQRWVVEEHPDVAAEAQRLALKLDPLTERLKADRPRKPRFWWW